MATQLRSGEQTRAASSSPLHAVSQPIGQDEQDEQDEQDAEGMAMTDAAFRPSRLAPLSTLEVCQSIGRELGRGRSVQLNWAEVRAGEAGGEGSHHIILHNSGYHAPHTTHLRMACSTTRSRTRSFPVSS